MGDLFYRRVPGPQDTYFTSSVAYKYHQDGFLAQGLGKEAQLQVRTGADYDDRQGWDLWGCVWAQQEMGLEYGRPRSSQWDYCLSFRQSRDEGLTQNKVKHTAVRHQHSSIRMSVGE